ncbi:MULTISPECIES: acetyl-CoA C-acyltransferase [Microvirgula]|uniref:Acetyl-CoA C-acyltransferase n=1 Tax=Microvirgula aerodenitrificans TaxID=57480 RepID=A0A2S0P9K5_9NEIS|nr:MULTISPECIES: acetyl-CoA C-acyltransferase [Microvirgula]AVY93983.1 acetyl-CoA C-acyltransferase [Microvirgula aerodenitrificans]RAS11739.1 acetyl-CoA C-acetyltransferase [Microvirgula sp. AG722]
MQQQDPVVIVSAVRTPIGGFQGHLAPVAAPTLGAAALRAAITRAGIGADDVDELLMGCVLPAGLGQAPARQAALGAGLSEHTPCTTVNKMCGSGMKTLMQAHDALLAGSARVVAAGGMESMSNAPYLLPKARTGLRMGHGEVKDHMFLDGLEDVYEKGTLMGVFAERCAAHYGFTREQQDTFAIRSLLRAQEAIREGAFRDEIVPVDVPQRGGNQVIDTDEQPLAARLDRIPTLKPAFAADGTVTAANASSISDGAAALVLMRESEAARRGLKPIARIDGHTSFAHAPSWFTTAPVGAMRALFERTGWRQADVDLYEINEAFAVVTLAAITELDLPADKVNVNGGACALGHPVGASGARIVVTLIHALRQRGLKRGIASLCIGGGEATAMAITLL